MARNPGEYFAEKLTSRARWPDFHIEAETLRQRIADLGPFNISDALRAFYHLYAERFEKPRWGNKTTKNISHMSFIFKLLPEARFIHIIRDGRDVALSVSKQYFGPYSIREAAEWWVSKIKEARRQIDDLEYYMEIRYEDLVLHTEAVLKEVCRFIELSWNPVMLDYYKTSEARLNELHDLVDRDGKSLKGENRRGKHSLTSKPPQSDRIGSWKKEMTESDKEWFEKVAGTLLESLGYEVNAKQTARVACV